jgi:ABC-type transport system substrate-binding protein
MNNGITSLDPAFARTQDNIWAVNQLFNGLVQLDHNLKLKACVADSWHIDSSGKIYDFFLRKDVYFHLHPANPGRKRLQLNAYDAQFSFERLTDPSLASPGAWIFRNRVRSEGFEVLDSFHLRIHLNQAFAPFIYMLSMPYCYLVPKTIASNPSVDFARNPSGTGPFKFVQWRDGVKLILHKNERYFEKDEQGIPLPYLDALSISFIPSKQAEFMEFLQGNLDMFNGLESSFKDQVINKKAELMPKLRNDYVIEINEFLNTEFIGINVSQPDANPFLAQVAFRKALSLAINRAKMIRYLRNGLGETQLSGFSPSSLHPASERKYVHDPEKAKALLDSIGYDKSTPLVLSTTADYLDLMIFIQSAWSEVGISSKIEVLPASVLKDQKSQGQLELFRSSWIADYPDAENFLSCFYGPNETPSGPNYSEYSNAYFDQQYLELCRSSELESRQDIVERMENQLHQDMPVIPLFYDQSVRLYPKYVQTAPNNPLNQLFLKRFDLSSREF